MLRNPVHPGKVLADELVELGITPTELARQLRVPHTRIYSIIRGTRAVTGDTALRLGHWFRTSAAFWMNLQNAHDIALAHRTHQREIARLPMRTQPEGK